MPDNVKVAYIFPGQGSQKVGMGRDLYDKFESAREVFQTADRVLGASLSDLCFNGPEEELRQTINAQPALVTMGYACYQAARSVLGQDNLSPPSFLAGHSLGEYTALIFAGVADFTTAVYLARERGRLMQEAGQRGAGGMAAILGLDETTVISICGESGTWLANINCPGQLVISGSSANIEKAIKLALAKGANRALPLQVSGAFHSPLMQPAVQGLAAVIARQNLKNPSIPIIGNVDARPLADSQAVKTELLQQLTSGVQWQKSVEYMIQNGAGTFIEIGPGKVLAGLIKRISKEVNVLNIGETADLKNLAV